MAYDVLLNKRCTERGYFKKEALQRLLDEHVSEQYDHSYRIWALLFLELWHTMFIDGEMTPPINADTKTVSV